MELITTKHFIKRLGLQTNMELMLHNVRKTAFKIEFRLDQSTSAEVYARIDFSRWLADCECGGAEYVDPDEPVFYCCSCGNKKHGGKLRPVVFPAPEEIRAITAALEERPVIEPPVLDPVERAFNSRPAIPGLGRSWSPGETAEDLRQQNQKAKKVL